MVDYTFGIILAILVNICYYCKWKKAVQITQKDNTKGERDVHDRAVIIKVAVGFKEHRFGLIARARHDLAHCALSSDFYKNAELKFPHYEVEIVEPHFKKSKTGKLNYHYSDKDGLAYVCYPRSIDSQHELMEVLKVWAVGQVCVITMDCYLNDLLVKAGGKSNFLNWASGLGIRLSAEPVVA